ncbi:hypothetical protein D3C81_892200 [compost metagenome]
MQKEPDTSPAISLAICKGRYSSLPTANNLILESDNTARVSLTFNQLLKISMLGSCIKICFALVAASNSSRKKPSPIPTIRTYWLSIFSFNVRIHFLASSFALYLLCRKYESPPDLTIRLGSLLRVRITSSCLSSAALSITLSKAG